MPYEEKNHGEWEIALQIAFHKRKLSIHSILLTMSGLLTAGLSAYFQTRYLYFYDYSYLSDVSHRLSVGQIPYKDFDLVLTPGTFYTHYWFSTIFGFSSLSSQMLVILISTATTLVFIEIANHLLLGIKNQAIKYSPYLAFPLLGPTYMVSFPLYDVFSTLAVGTSILITLKVFANPMASKPKLVLVGACVTLPLLFKQNVGLFFVLLFLAALLLGYFKKLFSLKILIWTHLGCLIAFVIFGITLRLNHMTGVFLEQVFIYASDAKGVSLLTELLRYKDKYLLATVVAMIIVALIPRLRKFTFVLPIALGGIVSLITLSILLVNRISGSEFPVNRPLINWLLILPICVAIALSAVKNKMESKREVYLVSALLIGALFGAYLSQGYKGSSYSWGGAYLLVSYMAILSIGVITRKQSAIFILIILSTSLWYCDYSFSGVRYADKKFISQDFELDLSDATDGYLPIRPSERKEIRQLREFFGNNPGTFVQLPMEDPLVLIDPNYVPQGKCSQLIWITCTNPKDAANLLLNNPPDYFILKGQIQLPWNPEPDADPVIQRIVDCLQPELQLPNYAIYKSNQRDRCLELGSANE